MTDLASLSLRIDSREAARATSDLDRLTTAARRTRAETDDLTGSWDQYSKSLSRGVNVMSFALRALPVVAIGAALKNLASDGIRFGDQIAKAAQSAGIAAGEFSQYAAVAKSMGAELPVVSSAFETLGRKISQSAAGNKEATRALAQLGLSAEFLRRLNPGEQLEQVADALMRLQNQSDRTALGNELLGGSFEQLAPALAEGAVGLRKLREEQERLGNTLTTEQAARMAEAQKAIRAMKQEWASFGLTLGNFVSPKVTQLAKELTALQRIYFGSGSIAENTRALRDEMRGFGGGTGGTGRSGGGRGLGGVLDPAEIAEALRDLDRAKVEAERFAESMRKASLAFDVDAIKRQLSIAASEFVNYEDLLDAERRAGLISEREYYAEKRLLLEQSAAAQVAALEAESKRLKADKLAGPEQLEQQRKIADNEAQIAIIREKAATQVTVLGKQQEAALGDVERAYEDARVSAERYLEVLRERYRIEVEGLGLGREARERAQGRNSLDREYTDRIDDLRRDRRKAADDDQRAQIDEEIAIQQSAHQRALQDFDDYYAQLKDKQGSFFTGASEALQNYIDESANVAAQSEAVFSRAFHGMEEALTDFVMTGKLDFKSLADAIIADLIRIQMRSMLTQIFGGVLGGLFGGAGKLSGSSGVGALTGSTVGYAANGGDISGPTVVGEKGPELIFPRTPMTVIPNHALGGVTINQYLTPSPGMDVAQFSGVMQQFKAEAKHEVYQDMARNRWRRVTG